MGYTSRITTNLDVYGVIPQNIVATLNSDPEIRFWFSIEEESIQESGESGKAYELVETVKRMAALIRANGADIDGDIVVHGEEQGDVWRIVLENGFIATQEARLAWDQDYKMKEKLS